jgi:hypothetical protein
LLDCPQGPGLAGRIGKEFGKIGAVLAFTTDCVGPGPILRGCQRLGDASLQVRDARSMQGVECCRT